MFVQENSRFDNLNWQKDSPGRIVSLLVKVDDVRFNLVNISTVMKVQMINVWKFIIWLSRNDFYFRNLQPSFVDVIESVKSRVRFYLPIFGARFPSSRRRRFFVRQWRARGLFASLVGSNVIVSL